MFNRRMFVALAMCLAVSASSAFAGGNGGTKKDPTIRVKNNSGNPVYVFVDVLPEDIQEAADSDDPAGAFDDLGGKLVAGGGHTEFSVKAGDHNVIAVDTVEQEAIANKPVNVKKGQKKTVTVP